MSPPTNCTLCGDPFCDCSGAVVSVLLVPAGVGRRLEGLTHARDTRPLVIVSTHRLELMDDYSHQDLTLTVTSGTTLTELDELVRPHGQHLPIDAPMPNDATLGGVIGCNAGGPRSRLHGPIGHSLIGARMVLANSQAIKSGARTVKNVAGYDLHKLWIGSYGSLGILTSVNLRLKPRAEEFRMARIVAENTAQADVILTRLLAGSTRPCLLEVLNAAAAADFGDPLPNGSLLIMVGYEDVAEAVRWQLDQLVEDLGNAVEVFDRSASPEQYRRMVDWPAKSADYSFETSATVQGRRSLLDYCAVHDIAVMARAPTGVLVGHGAGELTLENAVFGLGGAQVDVGSADPALDASSQT